MESTYTTIQGDTWDIIAYRVYGSEKYIGYLMQSNFDLLDIFIFSSGTIIKTSALAETTSAISDLPIWRD
jgi:phage tail protein X